MIFEWIIVLGLSPALNIHNYANYADFVSPVTILDPFRIYYKRLLLYHYHGRNAYSFFSARLIWP